MAHASPRRWLAAAAVPLLALACLLVAVPIAAPAGAHAVLISSQPAAGETVTGLDEVTLSFAGEVAPDGAHRLAVESADGTVVEAVDYALADPRTLVASLDGVPAGGAEIRWEVVGTDGHRETGRIPVTVEAATVDPDPGPREGGGATTVPPSTATPSTEPAAPVDGADAPLALVASTPPPGARVSDLEEVRLDFDADLADVSSHLVAVRTPGGGVLPAGSIERPDRRTLVASFPDELAEGEHVLLWEVTAADGSLVGGQVPVTVATADQHGGLAAPIAWIALAALVAVAVISSAYRARSRSGAGATRRDPPAVP